jgi:hypothetical protein
MILGIVMLSAIGYVTMSTQERPFRALNVHVNPVLGWGWALASLLANMVWALPQYSLATGALQQNLLPGVVGPDSPMGDFYGKLAISISILVITIAITWSYDRPGKGVKLYETILKLMVAMIVLCFFGEHVAYWTDIIIRNQRDVLISAAATAVGINMTFLFPYSILRRGWTKEFRGFAKFDLGLGMLIPFLLATSCVIIAASSQFHAKPAYGFFVQQTEDMEEVPQASTAQLSNYFNLLEPLLAEDAQNDNLGELSDLELLAEMPSFLGTRWFADVQAGLLEQPLESTAHMDARKNLEKAIRIEKLDEADRYVAATMVTRDAFDLAKSLRPFTGAGIADWAFGLGVVGMTLSTITLLMLISGFVICEIFDLPPTGWPHRLGTLCAATGALGPFFWNKAKFWLAVPTSVFCFILLPIAYWAFFFMMNQRKLLKDEMPTGGRRVAWNVLMGIAATVASIASVITVQDKAGAKGLAAVVVFVGLAVVVHFMRPRGSVKNSSAE